MQLLRSADDDDSDDDDDACIRVDRAPFLPVLALKCSDASSTFLQFSNRKIH